MFEFMVGLFIADAASTNPGATSQQLLVAMLVTFLGLCFLVKNATVSSDGDVKNTISVIWKSLKQRITR